MYTKDLLWGATIENYVLSLPQIFQEIMNMKFNSIVMAAIMLALTLAAKADYTSFTVKETSGTWTAFTLKNLRLTFANDQVTVSNAEQTEVFKIADVYSFLFTDEPTGIHNAAESRTIVSMESGQIRLKAKPGTLAQVYGPDGKVMCSARIGQEGVPVFIGNLMPGIYVVKAGQERCKILVK